MKSLLLLAISWLLNTCALAQVVEQPGQASVASPDQQLRFVFYQKTDTAGKRALYYRVTYKQQTVIRDSLLDLRLDNHLSENAMALKLDRQEKWFDNLKITGITNASHDSRWQPVVGERATVRDHYNQLTVNLVKDDNPTYPLALEVRAYDQGVAFRFTFPENVKGTYYRITAENTEFTFPAQTKAWFHGWGQAPYQLLPLANWPDESERPLTLALPGNLHVALLEGALTDYSRTKFKLHKDKPDTLVTSMHDPADLLSPFSTPWRGVMVAESARALANNNDFILNLNPPSALADTSWIKPGKIIRVMVQNTASARAYIDFAARHQLQYILFDYGWYGPGFQFASDATKVALPDLDLPGVIQYAASKGIGVWLYVNQQALLAQGDTLFKTYQQWGVKGVKFGFVQVGSHRWTTWLNQAIRQAAAAGLMVNVHDDWRPTGEQRTWPNLMTAEGIRGNEEMPDATHNTVLPFTRFLAGAADYTFCYYDQRIKTTHAHQLALATIYYSPLQTLYWYDRPEMSQHEPELEFWDRMPASWDDSKVLQGDPGQFVSTARRKGSDWFVGTITNNDARQLQLKFDFLPAGKRYTATVFEDDTRAPTRTKVGVRKLAVDSRTVIDVKLLPSGGQAIWLTPEK